MKPLAVDLCAGLGGWAHGLLAEGWDCIGFDIERHVYSDDHYPAQLVLQDIRTIDGRQFRGKVSLIVASPPCQEFSYMAMPWSRAKAIAAEYRSGVRDVKKLTELFDACVRIGREAECPIVIENVRGAQPWVGRSRWAFGSFHLWGDVPALMPMTKAVKVPTMGAGWYPPDHPKHVAGLGFNTHAERNLREGQKVPGFRFDGSGKSFQTASVEGLKGIPHSPTRHWTNPDENGTKNGNDWFGSGIDCSLPRRAGSKSKARKAASAAIAKIPLPLARWVASVYYPKHYVRYI